ncbi:hypothetical protein OESDEN_24129 [Oesophagostomum dentatum]|uniref:Uncharacterized protein n=1 Tax=Oesophagostomum dentatum TaxID=61180 RepID=A0A0B1RX89_OESDE|nr:hypothetical protein OESDEN_24129 [Oesophagostomum dentatum]
MRTAPAMSMTEIDQKRVASVVSVEVADVVTASVEDAVAEVADPLQLLIMMTEQRRASRVKQ